MDSKSLHMNMEPLLSSDRKPPTKTNSAITFSARPTSPVRNSRLATSPLPSNVPRSFGDSSYHQLYPNRSSQVIIRQQEKHAVLWFSGLLLTTLFAILLLVSEYRNVTFSGSFYTTVTTQRAGTQIVVQIIAALLGAIQVTALCRVFNYATRIHMTKAVPLARLPFWASISHRSFRWALPAYQLVPLLLFLTACTIPSAIWAGALSPIVTTAKTQANFTIPTYKHIENIKEWPSEVGRTGPSLRTEKGFFMYSPSVLSASDLTHAIASGSPTNGQPRQHAKLDNTKYIYNGRSYGVGAAVGLTDDFSPMVVSYSYHEFGYDAQTTCIYNETSGYRIDAIATDEVILNSQHLLWPVVGFMPDSDLSKGTSGQEYNTFYGHGNGSIVSIGSAYNFRKGLRYFAIAAGDNYTMLNLAQCQTEYVPALFQVDVAVSGKNITVSKVLYDTEAPDIEPTGILTHTVHRQISAFSSHMMGLYQSEVGNALNLSISDFRTSVQNSVSEEMTTLSGIANSFTAVIDDVLSVYSAAQIMIQRDSQPVTAQMTINAVRLGEKVYIVANFIINLVVVLIIIAEAIRTRAWRELSTFDYCDPQILIHAASRSASMFRQEHDMVALAEGYTYTLVGGRPNKMEMEIMEDR